jgi:Flp pilus assembly pilin Flp
MGPTAYPVPATIRPMANRMEHATAEGSEQGASLVEYALLLAMIALVAIAAVTLVGGATGSQLSSATTLLTQ